MSIKDLRGQKKAFALKFELQEVGCLLISVLGTELGLLQEYYVLLNAMQSSQAHKVSLKRHKINYLMVNSEQK